MSRAVARLGHRPLSVACARGRVMNSSATLAMNWPAAWASARRSSIVLLLGSMPLRCSRKSLRGRLSGFVRVIMGTGQHSPHKLAVQTGALQTRCLTVSVNTARTKMERTPSPYHFRVPGVAGFHAFKSRSVEHGFICDVLSRGKHRQLWGNIFAVKWALYHVHLFDKSVL